MSLLIPDLRPLTTEEVHVLEWLLDHGTEVALDFKHQLPKVSVVSRCGCGCPTIDLAVNGIAALLSSPSTILADAEGLSPEGVPVGIILHARRGLISEMEIYSKSGQDDQFSLPTIDSLSVLF